METRVAGASVTAWIDASAGVAGDMLLAALIDAGATLEGVQAAVEAVIPGTVRFVRSEVTRAGMRATKVDVELLVADQHHRPWSTIRRLLEAAAISDRTRGRALAAFRALADVEARAHGVDVEEVHFHEVGAWDSIADVVGCCSALDELGVDEVVVSTIAVGSGTVRAAHGRIPVPVPAVAGLSAGWTIEAVGDGELATPTGMALVTTLAGTQGAVPRMQVRATGVGAGTKDVEGRANVVRVVVGDQADEVGAGAGRGLEQEQMVVLEANVDDLDPRVWPTVLDGLIAAGAADAWLVPILMKKGRPAHTLTVLARTEDAARLRDVILDETSTIGVREKPVDRWSLARGWVDVEVGGERVAIKVAHRDGVIVQATPEFRDAATAAAKLGRPVRDVLESASAASVAAGLVRGAAVPSGLRRSPA